MKKDQRCSIYIYFYQEKMKREGIRKGCKERIVNITGKVQAKKGGIHTDCFHWFRHVILYPSY